MMMIRKRYNFSVPGSLENDVDEILLVRTVIPLRQVAVAVRVGGWWSHLNSIDTPTTLEPVSKHYS